MITDFFPATVDMPVLVEVNEVFSPMFRESPSPAEKTANRDDMVSE